MLEPSQQYGRADLDALADAEGLISGRIFPAGVMSRIILHVGTHKTATTTVQDSWH